MKLNRKSLLNILGVDEKKLEERIRIDLSNQNISQIDEKTFRDLKKMVSINLSGNKISELGERSLEGLKNLKTINFSDNKIMKKLLKA
jgi:Leucine-rich repeat (LRR) protein